MTLSEGVLATSPKRRFLDGPKAEVKKSSKPSPKGVGCEFCPLNEVPGIHKVMGEVHGREVFIWGWHRGEMRTKLDENLWGSPVSCSGRN